MIGFLDCRFSFGGRGDACFAAGRLARGRARGRNEERDGTDGSCRSFLQPSCRAEIHQTPPLRRKEVGGGKVSREGSSNSCKSQIVVIIWKKIKMDLPS